MENVQDMCAINDPLGQTHSLASSDHYSYLNFVLFYKILKVGMDGRTYRQHVWKYRSLRPWLLDQKIATLSKTRAMA